MKIIINKNQIQEQPEQFIRRAGYAFIIDNRTGNESFVRRLGNNFYPRFHMYIKREDDKIIFNLHMDQKKPSYQGTHAHNAEYDGEVVEKEINRLKSLISKNDLPPYFDKSGRVDNKAPFFAKNENNDNKKEEKGLWAKLFS